MHKNGFFALKCALILVPIFITLNLLLQEISSSHLSEIQDWSFLQARNVSYNKALFKQSSLSFNGCKNPIEFAVNVARVRLQREIVLNEDLEAQKVLEEMVIPSPWQRDKAPVHALVKAQSEKELRVGDDIPRHLSRPILIVSTWRSGSTFLSDLLNHYPGAFHSAEPLNYVGYLKSQSPLSLLKDIFHCEYNQAIFDYINNVVRTNYLFIPYNHRLAKVCKNIFPNNSACYMPDLVNGICKICPIRLIREVQLRMGDAGLLINDPALTNLKIIALFRDPRGMMNSRASIDWCDEIQDCSDLRSVCSNMEEDVNSALELRDRYPDTVHVVRYEDLAKNTREVAAKILSFLELPPCQQIERFIESHTKDESHARSVNVDPYETFRDSSSAALAWKKEMNFQYVKVIQEICRRPMKTMGYKFLTSTEQKDDINFDTVLPISVHNKP